MSLRFALCEKGCRSSIGACLVVAQVRLAVEVGTRGLMVGVRALASLLAKCLDWHVVEDCEWRRRSDVGFLSFCVFTP